ncbi:uncharacterized protein SPAPADRAFT_142179 [Spathaspora passalidarum NRRL Y-27907]|uniref:glutathione-specific gamma-glutamylcyclotransferase n=1 Tax=Spathaspora passalidarum (strain NRRL Y-27907 / 11-Y1) TaxID=619300 RepID=G3ASJ3_SPAPN|nr:uncharacterized protein SPAPADRAFT_142179 [Spathaspora passalidarum NRRL Y-27907]EGW30679.1 hypothetical protein SPAPADRAFT_142179 [Spathaspora passalidarum NRRL Y-27907]
MTNEGMWVIGYGSLIFKPPPHVQFKVTGYIKGFIRRFWQSSSDHRGTPQSPGRVVTLVSLSDLQTHTRFHNDLHMYELKGHAYEAECVSSGESDLDSIADISKKISDLSQDDLRVWGVAYYIGSEHVAEVKEYLDIREQDGYSTHKVPFHILNVEGGDKDKDIIDTIPKDPLTGDLFIESMIYIGTIENESFIGPESIEKTAKVIKTSHGPSGPNKEYLINLTEAVRHLDPKLRSHDYYLEDLVKLVN